MFKKLLEIYTKEVINNRSSMKTKNTKIRLLAISLILSISMIGFGYSVVGAITQPYRTKDTSIKPGMVVAVVTGGESEKKDNGSTPSPLVEKSSQSKAELTVGIVTSWGGSTLAYSDGKSDELFVANSGRALAYVSDVNGVPQPGDLLVPSPLTGMLMRAGDGAQGVIGALVGQFSAEGAEAHTLKDGQSVRVAVLQVDMDVRPGSKSIPQVNAVQSLAKRLTGRDVSAVQAIVALIVMVLTVIVAGSVCYAAVANYLTAMGRNPMASKQLKHSLWQMLGLVLGVFGGGLVASAAVLWM